MKFLLGPTQSGTFLSKLCIVTFLVFCQSSVNTRLCEHQNQYNDM